VRRLPNTRILNCCVWYRYRERSTQLESLQTEPLEEHLESAANNHLMRFRQELRMASVEDLGRFLRRFVGEMPKLASPPAAKPKVRPKTSGPIRATRPVSPQFPGQHSHHKRMHSSRPSTVGATGRTRTTEHLGNTHANSAREYVGQATAAQILSSPAGIGENIPAPSPAISTVLAGSSTGAARLFQSHRKNDPVILSSDTKHSLAWQSKSRPWSAGTASRKKGSTVKPRESAESSNRSQIHTAQYNDGKSFADRIRNLTTQAQLHPRSSTKKTRPHSAKFSN